MVADSCRVNYQTLLITYLKLTIRIAKHAWREKISNQFPSVYQCCDGDLNKFVLLLRNGIYPHEYMDSWERFDETSLPPEKAFYIKLNLEDISDKDYNHAQNIWEVFGINNLGEYHVLYFQCDALLLADVFEKFRDTCIEIYRLYPFHFLPAPGLAWKTCFKKTNVNLEVLTDTDMLLMIEAGIRGGMCQSVHRYAKANNKYMKKYDKNIESSYLMYLDANDLYGWAMSQKLPVDGFKWQDDLSRFNERFIKSYNEKSDIGYFLEVDVKYPKKNYLVLIKIYRFYLKEKNYKM